MITFYAAQAKLLQDKLRQKDVDEKQSNISLRIGTVDRFQGMERSIIIVSFVRNNKKKDIGFARKPERINVALSRAQKLLIIVGCSELFCNTQIDSTIIYKKVVEIVKQENGVKNVSDIRS